MDTLSTYRLCDRNFDVSMAIGAISPAMGQKTVYLSNLTLISVLYLPKWKCNLLSISKLTNDINFSVTSFPSHCDFLNLFSGKMTDNAEEKYSFTTF